MSERALRTAAWVGVAALMLLHLDFWRSQRAALWFGWMPEELLYRLLWMFLAWLYLLFFCARIWRKEETEGVES